MSKEKFKKVINQVRNNTAKHSPEILTGIGIAGMITTTILAVKATPKALELIEEARDNKSVYSEADDDWVDVPLTKKEIVQTTWRCYIPAIVTGTVSIACLVGASSVNYKRNAALATAYTLSETALKEYKNKVIETIGEKKEKAVTDAIAKDRIEKNPLGDREIIISDDSEVLCYDSISGRYFKSSIPNIERAVNKLNREMIETIYVSLNDLYYELGLSNTKLGNDLGWNIDRGLIEVRFSAQVSDDNRPCVVLDYTIAPKYDFYK